MENIKKNWYRYVVEYVGITIGTIIMALSIDLFLEPNTIAPGGVTGLAIVIKKITGIDVAITNLSIDIPLFIFGLIVLGKAFGAKTLYGTLSLSFFIKVLPKGSLVDELLLAAVFGGVLMGIGLGIVFRSGGTTGGTDLAAAILNKFFPNFSTATFMMSIDLCVVTIAGIVNKKLETSLYSIITLYIIVKVIDSILEGLGYAKAFFIISQYPDKIGNTILEKLNRGVTVLKGRGMYTGKDRDVLLCVVNRSQVTKLKEIVHQIDKNAFVMVADIYEVLGEGFKEIKTTG
ncbi:membrane protein [Caloranaerobacter azorensis H53214]|uniref:Membrane protein n=1 Tax=Caloranaerobacter azorensis H53214 TaxID=1156417 RepID=A0A096BIF1_9FIRM|nr:YitT family protein [Caloranaerobacter azorensis]KGG80513.1 membrane protein [Caloranaerobacter azorensis H53214]